MVHYWFPGGSLLCPSCGFVELTENKGLAPRRGWTLFRFGDAYAASLLAAAYKDLNIRDDG